MNFNLTEEQEMLRRTACEFLERECPVTLVREMAGDEKGYPVELWQKMARLGWLGLVFPEKYGGANGTFLDLVVLVEEMGGALLPGPFFATVVMGGLYILAAGSDEQKEKLIPEISAGDLLCTLAITEPEGEEYDASSISLRAVFEKDAYSISGVKLFVRDAQVADSILCVARTSEEANQEEGLTTFILDAKSPGIAINPLRTMSGDHQCEVVFENVKVPVKNVLGELNNGWPQVKNVLQKATVVLCADMVGGAQRVLDMTVDYSKQRVQFGRPIGSMQALQHHCANMVVSIEAARALTYEAAGLINRGLPCTAEVSMAKAFVSECYTQISQLGMMIHGGVGFMEDHALPLYYRRAKAAEVILGDPDSHREMIARQILD